MRRNGVTLSGLNYDSQILNSTWSDVQDQYVDIEPGGSAVEGIVISGNNFLAHQNAKIAVAVSGSATRDVVLSNNTVDDGQLQAVYADHLVIADNAISGSVGAIYLKGDVREVVVTGNAIDVTGTASCVFAESNGSSEPSDLIVSQNMCKHENGGGIAYYSGAGRVSVVGNVIRATGTGTTSGISFGTLSSTAMNMLVAADNVIDNETNVVSLTARYAHLDNVTISGNVVRSTKTYSRGVIHTVYNANGYTQDYATRCRVDGNVLDTAATPHIVNTPDSGSIGPDAGEGCLAHGDEEP
jgi:hypothetical protein